MEKYFAVILIEKSNYIKLLQRNVDKQYLFIAFTRELIQLTPIKSINLHLVEKGGEEKRLGKK